MNKFYKQILFVPLLGAFPNCTIVSGLFDEGKIVGTSASFSGIYVSYVLVGKWLNQAVCNLLEKIHFLNEL